MRQLRPELYLDTSDRATYLLDAMTIEYCLDAVTARNQTHDFEIFCRKLCERTICPNLKPATGPEGGGDSKADTETIPVADEIATLGSFEKTSGSRGMLIKFSEIQFAGEQEDDGADGGETGVAACFALGSLEEAIDQARARTAVPAGPVPKASIQRGTCFTAISEQPSWNVRVRPEVR